MNKSSENLGRPLVPYSQSAKVLKPEISSFDDSSMLISSQFSPILMSGDLIVTTLLLRAGMIGSIPRLTSWARSFLLS